MDVQQLALKKHVSGSRATLKAIQKGQAHAVFLAADAEKRILQPLCEACEAQGVPITQVATMAELGQAAKLQVPAAAAAILKP